MYPLIEKYRPKTFEEVIGVDTATLSSLVNKVGEFPNLMFYGHAGTGKTTCAKIIMKELAPIDVLRINGSDTTGVDTIRDKVFNFVSAKSGVAGKPKIVWVEEFDYMSQSAFAALRSMMESYSKNARFIVTLNFLSKIPEPIQSRFSLFNFVKPTSEAILPRLKFICREEGISASDEDLILLAEKNNFDIRATINSLQKLTSNDDNVLNVKDVEEFKNVAQEVFDLIQEGNWTRIRYEIPNKYPDYNALLVDLEQLFFASELPTSKKAEANEIIARGMYEMSLSFDPNICFAAICSKLIKAVR